MYWNVRSSLSSYVSSGCRATSDVYMLVKDRDRHRLHVTYHSQAQIGAIELLKLQHPTVVSWVS